MILTVDVGNTQITGGLFEDGKLVLQFRQTTSAKTTSDEIGLFFRSVIRENGFRRENIPAMMAAVVVISLPLIVLFLVFHKKIMEGVSRGGTKG